MTSSDAETDSKPIIIIIIKAKKLKLRLRLLNMCSIKKKLTKCKCPQKTKKLHIMMMHGVYIVFTWCSKQ